jgi:hypothetical protein
VDDLQSSIFDPRSTIHDLQTTIYNPRSPILITTEHGHSCPCLSSNLLFNPQSPIPNHQSSISSASLGGLGALAVNPHALKQPEKSLSGPENSLAQSPQAR